MTRREKLIDNYEDALFAVLMDKVAEEEGAKLREENQRLQNDPEAAVPEHVDAVARQTIRKAFAGQNRRSALHVARRVLNTVAMIVLICSAIFVTAYAAFPEVRVKTLNLLIQSSDVASRIMVLNDGEISNRENSGNEEKVLCGYSLPTLPEFFVVEMNEDQHGGWVEYANAQEETLRIDIMKRGTKYIDTEDVDTFEDVVINGYSGIISEKGNRICISWSDINQDNYLTLVCINFQRNVALEIAQQILFIES